MVFNGSDRNAHDEYCKRLTATETVLPLQFRPQEDAVAYVQREFGWVVDFKRSLETVSWLGKPETPPEPPKRVLPARESVAVLDRAIELLDGGRGWIKHQRRLGGRFCIMGALQEARKRRGSPLPDKAGVYGARAIADMTGGQRRIIAFNDGDAGYEDVDLVLRRARDRAQAAAHGVPFRLVLEHG
jgi:hypothetical protein